MSKKINSPQALLVLKGFLRSKGRKVPSDTELNQFLDKMRFHVAVHTVAAVVVNTLIITLLALAASAAFGLPLFRGTLGFLVLHMMFNSKPTKRSGLNDLDKEMESFAATLPPDLTEFYPAGDK